MTKRVAYVDESVRARSGAYVLAATCLDVNDCDRARVAVRALARSGQRFHWRLSVRSAQIRALGVVEALPATHLVVIAGPLDPRRQERARRLCLQRLLHELTTRGTSLVIMESRTTSLNRRDTAAIDAFRSAQIIGPDIAIEHGYPAGLSGEPLLWVADIVAGAVGLELDHGTQLPIRLADLITRYEVALR